MEQVVVLLFIAVFGDGEVSSHSTVFPTMEMCEHNEVILWSQKPEVYSESDVVGMFSECITLITRELKDVVPAT